MISASPSAHTNLSCPTHGMTPYVPIRLYTVCPASLTRMIGSHISANNGPRTRPRVPPHTLRNQAAVTPCPRGSGSPGVPGTFPERTSGGPPSDQIIQEGVTQTPAQRQAVLVVASHLPCTVQTWPATTRRTVHQSLEAPARYVAGTARGRRGSAQYAGLFAASAVQTPFQRTYSGGHLTPQVFEQDSTVSWFNGTFH